MKREIRFSKSTIELREDTGKAPVISGYAAVFAPARSEDMGGWVEQIDPHAFDEAVSGDVRGLYNHDANMILGRTKSGTMRLNLDAHGLRYEIDVPDTQVGRDLVTSMKRGDIDGSSFAFACKKDAWENDDASGEMLRTILKADLFDCSPVVYPAYPDASSAVRSMFPDGVPEVPKPDTRADKDCRCECASCLTGDCEDCDPDNCTDENCRCHERSRVLSDSDRNRLAIQIELRAHGVHK
jgi:hypothetical protein